jgi:hypothetical protein
MTYAQLVRNLGEPYHDSTGQMRDMLVPGRFLYVYGTFYADEGGVDLRGAVPLFVGRTPTSSCFERPDWWVNQIRELADFYVKAQFGDGEIDYRNYRTTIRLTGEKPTGQLPPGDRHDLAPGLRLASAYLLTGEDRFLEAPRRAPSTCASTCASTTPTRRSPTGTTASTSTAGARTRSSPRVRRRLRRHPGLRADLRAGRPDPDLPHHRRPADPADAELTIDLFDRFFLDTEKGGYFSHLDPITLDPRSEALGANRAKKNWNSVGDHAPAYLINLVLATGDERYTKMLEDTFDTITEHFPNYDESPSSRRSSSRTGRTTAPTCGSRTAASSATT